MNAKQKQFVLKKLIPFILREEGNGFGMSSWKVPVTQPFCIDGIAHNLPSCGTVACIGGSIQLLLKSDDIRDESNGAAIGLNLQRSETLFYGWRDSGRYGWPRVYRERYAEAKTPLAKAKVAVSLLKRIVNTNGKCLDGAKP